jgi:hypothetical protein
MAALSLVVLGGASAPDEGGAYWVGTCACDSDTPAYSCHGRKPVCAESEAHLRQQCSDRTNGSGSLLDAKASPAVGVDPVHGVCVGGSTGEGHTLTRDATGGESARPETPRALPQRRV